MSSYYLKAVLANESINITTITPVDSSYPFTTSFEANRIKFWILLSLQLLSVLCYIYIFLQFIYKKQLRQSVQNHVILLLLIVSFLFVTIALSLTLAYMYTSRVYPSTPIFCTLWNWYHYSNNIVNLYLMAFASIERNWLIFHPNLIKGTRSRILLHYCPLICCVIYPPLFYAGVMFIYDCRSFFDYTQLLCKWPCYFYNQDLANIDLYLNNYTPLFSIPVFCTTIYLRVFIQRHILKQQRFKWRRDKKLVLQLWLISSLYLAMWMPLQLTGLINTYWSPTFLLQEQIDYIFLFPYLIHIIYPYIILLSFRQKMRQSRQTAVIPGRKH